MEVVNYKFECNRLNSFHSWPVTFISPASLSKNGFLYTNVTDVCMCVFCHIQIGNWEESDVVELEHVRWSPACPYICGLPVGNVTIEDVQNVSMEGNDTVQRYINEPNSHTEENQKLPNISYNTYEKRKQSLEQFPAKSDKLAETGFYFSESKLRCFVCGLEIEIHTDDIEKFHRTKSPRCLLLQHCEEEDQSKPRCNICLDEPAVIATLKCGHVLGIKCFLSLTKHRCPFCRSDVSGYVRIYF